MGGWYRSNFTGHRSKHGCVYESFSPIPQTEILRVLKDDGYLIVVNPATNHLYAMREALFEQVNPHTPQKFVEQLQDLFELKEQQVIDAPLVLDQQALKILLL